MRCMTEVRDKSSNVSHDQSGDGTLTRKVPETSPAEPEETYVSMTITQPPSKHPTIAPQESYEIMTSAGILQREYPDNHSRDETFQTSPRNSLQEAKGHCYVNHTPITANPPASLMRINSDSKLAEHHYQNVIDRSTNEKLMNNVRILMDTVTQQSADISTLKKTVKDLKMRIEELEHQLEAEY